MENSWTGWWYIDSVQEICVWNEAISPRKFAGFKFGEDRWDAFFCDVLSTQKTYEDLWTTVKFLLTLSHGQAAIERGFSVNKEALAPNLKEDSLKVVHIVHNTISAKQIEIAEFVITDELLTSFSHANNRYKMYLMDKGSETWEPEKASKRKAVEEELTAAKKMKNELEVTAQKLAESADKKAKEAEKKIDVATMKTLLIESNASRKNLKR